MCLSSAIKKIGMVQNLLTLLVVIPVAFVSVSAHRPDVNVRAHPAKPFGLFLAPEGGFAD